MKRPWIPLHVGDYTKDTGHLRAAGNGAYLSLIMHYWSTGGLPTDDYSLATIAKMSDREWLQHKPTIQAFFHDGWKHKRIDAEIALADKRYERRATAGSKGGKARAMPEQCSSNAMPMQKQPTTYKEQEERKEERKERAREMRASPSFDEFWQIYPNKVGKSAAQKAFARIAQAQTTTFEILMTGLRAYVAKTDDRPWCNPATWLNQGRWDDQPAEAIHETSRRQQRSPITEALDRQAERYRCKDGDGDEVRENLVRLLPNR
jgi:uncharacterized protein YdaU (DUF1376 family)